MSDLTKKGLDKSMTLKTWLESHAIVSPYLLQLFPCTDRDCCPEPIDFPTMRFPVPDPARPGHYKPFKDVLNSRSEEGRFETDRPSKVTTKVNPSNSLDGGVTKSNLPVVLTPDNNEFPELVPELGFMVGANARYTISCSEHDCKKPRVIYTKLKLSSRQELCLAELASGRKGNFFKRKILGFGDFNNVCGLGCQKIV